MSRTSFADRWDLDPARREVLSTVIASVAAMDQVIAKSEANKAMLLRIAHGIAGEVAAEMNAPDGWQLPVRAIAADIAAATSTSDRTIRGRMEDAATLIERFPRTFSALLEGRLSRTHVNAITDEGARLRDPAARARYEDLVLARAAGQSPGRLRVIAKAIAEDCEPTALVERHNTAFEKRRTWVEDHGDGMGVFAVLTGIAEACAMQDRATSMAVALHRAAREAAAPAEERPAVEAPSEGETPAEDQSRAEGDVRDERTIDQFRADVITDLLLTGIPTAHVPDECGGNALAAIRATVQVTIPAATLTGAADQPGFLAGRGPLDPETARRLAGHASLWSRLFTDADTGSLRAVDSYVPTEGQKRFLRARDEHCRFPGCRQPVRRCDLDHTVPHSAGGPTAVSNLAALCRSHHLLKHHGNWTVAHGPGGVMTWTSPTGRVTRDHPAPIVRFLPTAPPGDPDPPPDSTPPF